MISSGEVRKRTGLSRHFYEDNNKKKHKDPPPYDPKFHFILLGFICFMIIIIIMVTIFYAPPTPKESKLAEIINAYLKGIPIFEIDFDSPQEFVDHVITNSDQENIVKFQESIDKFYGNKHAKIIENNGWKIMYEDENENEINQPGLICQKVGCFITIEIVDIISKIKKESFNDLYLLVSYKLNNDEGKIGMAEIWVDKLKNVDIDSKHENGKIIDGFKQDTLAISEYLDWKLNMTELNQSDQLYFHALIVNDIADARMVNKFKIFGFGLHLKSS